MEDNIQFTQRIDLTGLAENIEKLKRQISQVIVGQDEAINLIITSLLANGHVLIEGVPGVAKTLMAKLIARSVNTGFSRIQFTPDLMPSDVIGTTVFNNKTADFEFRPGPVFSNIILIDEINRSPAKTQAALFEVMEERQVTIDGVTHKMQNPFMVLATQNPIEHEGTYRLPEAQLDRFMMKVIMGYPKADEETQILQRAQEGHGAANISGLSAVLSETDIAYCQQMVGQVVVEEKLLGYITSIIQKTRQTPAFYLGASPRASLALLNCSKAWATIQGRDFITPDDIKFMTIPVLNHRVQLTAEKEMEGATTAIELKKIVELVEVPR